MYFTRKEKNNIPKYSCKTCGRVTSGGYCSYWGRKIDPYNKCFNHTNYHTVATTYKEPQQLQQIKEEYERRKTA